MTNNKKPIQSVSSVYGENDLSENNLFMGKFINFGYWKKISDTNDKISIESRIQASKDLYELLLNYLNITEGDKILEVGCGYGHGTVAAHDFADNTKVVGVDIRNEQIKRAKKTHADFIKNTSSIEFITAPAENLPFIANSIDKIFSVEAAQHFHSVPKFISEALRVLKPGGLIAITTFFANNDIAEKKLVKLLPSVAQNFDRVISFPSFLSLIKNKGAIIIESNSIGEFVWKQLDNWVKQNKDQTDIESWNQSWLEAIKRNLMDYYVVIIEKPQ